jgi:hypothetical protein
MAQSVSPSTSLSDLMRSSTPQFEHTWLPMQWHAGVMGAGAGWDKKMVAEIERLGHEGFELVSVVPQKDATWFILFFKRQTR